MEYKRFDATIVVRLDPEDEICESLLAIAEKEDIQFASISGIGAVNRIDIGVFETVEKKYYSNKFEDTFEIVSLAGTLSRMDGKQYIHAHMSVGDMKGNVVGGHLTSAIVSATAEIVLQIQPCVLNRKFSEKIGLNLFEF